VAARPESRRHCPEAARHRTMAPLPVGMLDVADPAAHRTGVVRGDWAAVPAQDGVVMDAHQAAASGGHCQTKQIDTLALSGNMVV